MLNREQTASRVCDLKDIVRHRGPRYEIHFTSRKTRNGSRMRPLSIPALAAWLVLPSLPGERKKNEEGRGGEGEEVLYLKSRAFPHRTR